MTQQPAPDSTPISQETVNKTLWEACDTFRGTVDPSEYKNYILVMLFVKYLSDVWVEQREKLQAEYGDNPERIASKLKNESFQMPDGCDFYSLHAQRNAPNIGEIIDKALSVIEDANKEKLSGVFRNISFNSEAALGRTPQRNQRLINLLNDFNKPALNLRPSRVGDLDIISNAYKFLISRFASDAGKRADEFYTPPEVSTLMARLLAPKPSDRICDPACGTGSLLIQCAKQVDSADYFVKGQELNSVTWALCMMNMLLHGVNVTTQDIAQGDTLREPMLLEHGDLMRFDVVVSNPPFSLDKWGADDAPKDSHNRFWRGIPPKSKGDYAFISHMIETMNNNGRMAVIVPHGVLFRGGSEGEIRRQLIEEGLLDAVIGLPPNLFYGTGIPVNILIFKRNRLQDSPILFIDASREFEQGKIQNRLNESQISRIVKTYNSRDSILGYSRLVDLAEIEQKGFNLNIPRYIDVETINQSSTTGQFVTLWKGPHEIFISYSRADIDSLNRIEEILTNYGLRCWVDREIDQGDSSWQKTIELAIEQSHSVVVLLSPTSKDREWVRREIEYARIHEKAIFPIIIAGDEKTSVPLVLAGTQACFYAQKPDELHNVAGKILDSIGFRDAGISIIDDWAAWTISHKLDNDNKPSWTNQKLDEVAYIRLPRQRHSESTNTGKYKLFSVNGEDRGLVDTPEFNGEYIIIPRMISAGGAISKRLWMTSGEFSLSPNCYAITSRDNEILLTKFLYYSLMISNLQQLVQTILMRAINRHDLLSLDIPIPPIDLQRLIIDEIEEELEVTNQRMNRLQKQLELLEKRPLLRIYQIITSE